MKAQWTYPKTEDIVFEAKLGQKINKHVESEKLVLTSFFCNCPVSFYGLTNTKTGSHPKLKQTMVTLLGMA